LRALVIYISVCLLLLIACNRQKEQKISNSYSPRVIEAHGYVVPKDSMAEPSVVIAGAPKVVKAGQPEVILTNTNVFPAGLPEVVLEGTPEIFIPGQDSMFLPVTVPAVEKPFHAGLTGKT
jgi:hypothetical protein